MQVLKVYTSTTKFWSRSSSFASFVINYPPRIDCSSISSSMVLRVRLCTEHCIFTAKFRVDRPPSYPKRLELYMSIFMTFHVGSFYAGAFWSAVVHVYIEIFWFSDSVTVTPSSVTKVHFIQIFFNSFIICIILGIMEMVHIIVPITSIISSNPFCPWKPGTAKLAHDASIFHQCALLPSVRSNVHA